MWKKVASGVAVISCLYLIKKHFRGTVCKCKTTLKGQIVIVTGANSGIGKALSFFLIQRGATVILACRNVEKGELVRQQLLEDKAEAVVFVAELDLNSFASTKRFADYIEFNFEEVFALVNNAGIFYYRQELTEDGFDVTLQTNYIGPSFLTILLLPRLQRVINVSSEAHRLVDENELKSIFENQTVKRSHFKAYGASKLALILHSKALSQQLISTNKAIYTVNPGNVETAIYRHYPPLSNPVLYALQWPIRRLVIKSPQEGAQSILHTLLMEKDPSAPYISECKVATPSPIATDDKLIASFNQLTLHQILKKN